MNEHNRNGIEQSKYFIALVTETYYDDPDCIEMVLYAKSLGKPMILYMKKGIKHLIPDLFKECKIRFIFEYDNIDDIKESADKLLNIFNSNG